MTIAEKNWILTKGSQKQKPLKVITKPKGSVGQKGCSLIERTRLDPEGEEEKGLHSNALVSKPTSRDALGGWASVPSKQRQGAGKLAERGQPPQAVKPRKARPRARVEVGRAVDPRRHLAEQGGGG
jgi:hypothetical protein